MPGASSGCKASEFNTLDNLIRLSTPRAGNTPPLHPDFAGAGQTYIYPMGPPDQAGEQLVNNEAHEYFSHHRGVNNQRHAYDVLSKIGGDFGVGSSCVDDACTLDVSSDPQTISASITNAQQPVEVDGDCLATVDFTVTLHDNCCLDIDNLGLEVTASNPTNNLTLGSVVIDSVVPSGSRDIATVAQGNDDLFCLWPPEHGYVCFDSSQFAPEVTDNCDAAPTWAFDSCSSDQPDNGPGDGNTVDDCVLDEDVQGFCARVERAGMIKAGRRYDLDIEATDVCGNVSVATEIGNIHVPRDMSAGLQCIDSTLP